MRSYALSSRRKLTFYALVSLNHFNLNNLILILINVHRLTIYVRFSGGVGSNKLLAKLACKSHKPCGVTALTRGGFNRISASVPFRDVPGFGGDLGVDVKQVFGGIFVNQLRYWLRIHANFNRLKSIVGDEQATTAKRLARGVCHEEVEDKLMFKGLNCSRNYLSMLPLFI